MGALPRPNQARHMTAVACSVVRSGLRRRDIHDAAPGRILSSGALYRVAPALPSQIGVVTGGRVIRRKCRRAEGRQAPGEVTRGLTALGPPYPGPDGPRLASDSAWPDLAQKL